MDVREIQRALIARGYDLGPSDADGDAGPKTIAAVTGFQRAAGLVPDGIAGPLTIRAPSIDKGDNGGPPLRASVEKPGWLVFAEALNRLREANRAAWSPRAGAHILLRQLVDAFVPRGPVVLGLDDTIERRWGRRIRARGIYRDPVRSSASHFVKTSGLRWISLMLLAEIPWAARVWALPFLTALAASERACRDQGRRHKTLLAVGRRLALHTAPPTRRDRLSERPRRLCPAAPCAASILRRAQDEGVVSQCLV